MITICRNNIFLVNLLILYSIVKQCSQLKRRTVFAKTATTVTPLNVNNILKGLRQVDSVIKKILLNPKDNQGSLLLQYLTGYNGLLDLLMGMLRRHELVGINILCDMYDTDGPRFLRANLTFDIYKEKFNWTDEHVNETIELIDETKEKWGFLDSYVVYWWTTPQPYDDGSEWEGWSNVHSDVSGDSSTSMS